ncbi:hypothetical protein [Streptomyces sp. ST2-7A]|uniref:hypothetical protein n=1 Tax=Streptomyces sp. ST2-7A TaxID=2907214 RepID=UPI001F2A3EA9|nr:hypothetical protein [Streptomyces sp. ST2-7A]MCE7083470.1 hypothetical protein [Streptomyces sp. ST2-7A]
MIIRKLDGNGQTTELISVLAPQPPRYHHTDTDGDLLLITTAEIPQRGPGVYFRTDPRGSSVPLDEIPALLEALEEIATCPACEAPPMEWCITCKKCRCETHENCARPHQN